MPPTEKMPGPACALAVLLAATALAFSPVLFADFIRLDDYGHLFDNPSLHRLSLSGLGALWAKSYFNLYIPVTYSVWWAAVTLASKLGALRDAAWLFHALNLVVHLVNASLVFVLVRTLLRARDRQPDGDTGGTTAALLSALLFALHPVQVETVAWVSELKGTLSTMFGLLGLRAYFRSNRRVAPAVFFALAMLAKPSAIAFPAVVFLLNRIVLAQSLRRSATTPALYTLILLPLVYATKRLQPDLDLDFVPPVSGRPLVAADAVLFYVSKLLFPYPLAIDYGRSPQQVLAHFPAWQAALSLLLLLAGIALVVKAIVRPPTEGGWRGLALGGWAILLLSLAPVLGFIPFGFQGLSTVADHYLYLPLVGVAIIVAGILVRFAASTILRPIAVAVLVVLGILSFRQARLWASTETLFTQTLKVNPRSHLAYHAIAEEHLRAGRFDQAIAWGEKAVAIKPDFLDAQIDLALAWSQQGEVAKAIDIYDATLARNPSTAGTRARPVSSLHNNLGMALMQVGRQAEAVAHFRKAVEIFPRSLNGHLNLGNVAFDEGRYADAVAEYEIAQTIRPGIPAVEQRLAHARRALTGK